MSRRANNFERRMVRKYTHSVPPCMATNQNVQVFSPFMALPQDLLRNGPTRLRTLEPSDVDWLLRWENAPEHWQVSGTIAPFSRAALEALCMGHQDIYSAEQLRWVIEERGKPVGAVDLFDFSALHLRSGIGILVDPAHRGKGTAGRALSMAVQHAEKVLLLKGLHAQVHGDNAASLKLFASEGFDQVGRFKDWTRTHDGWHDAVLLQKQFDWSVE